MEPERGEWAFQEGRERERVESAEDHQAQRLPLVQGPVQCIVARSRPIGTLRERVGRLTGDDAAGFAPSTIPLAYTRCVLRLQADRRMDDDSAIDHCENARSTSTVIRGQWCCGIPYAAKAGEAA